MLGTLLEKLGTLLPRNFIIANFFPMLFFAAMNGVMLYLNNDRFHQAVHNYFAMDTGGQALIGFPILIAIALAAYISSTLNLLQREILEGQYWPNRLKEALAAGQQRRADKFAKELENSRKYRRAFKKLKGLKRLRAARDHGNAQGNQPCEYLRDSEAARAVADLEKRKSRYDFIKPEQFENALNLLELALKACAVDDRRPALPDIDRKKLLNGDQEILVRCLQYAERRNENDYVERFNKKEFNYSRYNSLRQRWAISPNRFAATRSLAMR